MAWEGGKEAKDSITERLGHRQDAMKLYQRTKVSIYAKHPSDVFMQ